MLLRPIFKVQQRQLYLIIINILFLQHKNKGTKYYTEKYKVKSRSSQAHLRQTGSHCASPAPNFRKENDPGSWSGGTLNPNGTAAAHHVQRQRCAKGYRSSTGNLSCSFQHPRKFGFVTHKMELKSPSMTRPGDERPSPQSIYSKVPQAHLPTHTSPSCDPTSGAHMYTNQWLQHTHINTTGSSLWPVVSWKLWFKEGKWSVKTSWWNPWASTSSSKQKKANSPIPKQQKQPAFFSNVLAVSLHSCPQERTLNCSSQQYKNHLPLLYLYFSRIIFIFHNQTFQVCLQVKQEGEMGKKAEN